MGGSPADSPRTVKIITWNVNSIRTRLERVLGVLERHQPDLLCLQETKVTDDIFPHEALAEAGYQAVVHGQKTYNGVALIARELPQDVLNGFPGDPIPEQARVISGTLGGVRVINAYVVNGKDLDDPKFTMKLAWLDALLDWLEAEHDPAQPLVMLGDFNIAPDERDVWDLEYWKDKIFFSPAEHERLARLGRWGFTDLFRENCDEAGKFTWWDYRGGAFQRGNGLRIDLILGTAPIVARCEDVLIDRNERKKGDWEAKPSDHVPVLVTLKP
jgi:exodeoxyribonuclease III